MGFLSRTLLSLPVEQFRQVLLPLVSKPLKLSLLPDTNPPKVWISAAEIDTLGDKCICTDVLRKGKQLVMILQSKQGKISQTFYLFLHMVQSNNQNHTCICYQRILFSHSAPSLARA